MTELIVISFIVHVAKLTNSTFVSQSSFELAHKQGLIRNFAGGGAYCYMRSTVSRYVYSLVILSKCAITTEYMWFTCLTGPWCHPRNAQSILGLRSPFTYLNETIEYVGAGWSGISCPNMTKGILFANSPFEYDLRDFFSRLALCSKVDSHWSP